MTYIETVNHLFNMLPVYQKQGKSAIKKNLDNIIALCDYLDNPHHSFKSIHVGGTNGKGTVSHLIASVLQENGYRVGMYTSPHYVDFRERIKINGQYIEEEKVVSFVKDNQDLITKIQPSFFEVTVAMAFDYFRSSDVDFAVIEVGLGGRLDSTNIITPELSVITNIGMDHLDMLGDTIPKIATEKAGIIKPKVPIVIGEFHPESSIIFENKAKETESSISFASQIWNIKRLNKTEIILENAHRQLKFKNKNQGPFYITNIRTAITSIFHTKLNINDIHIINGINNYRKNTKYLGRWQWVENETNVLMDSGHNPHALEQSLTYLKTYINGTIHFVIGFVKGKDIESIIDLLPQNGKYYFSKPAIFRGAEVCSYQSTLEKRGLNYESYLTLNSALLAAKRSRSQNDLIFIGGSSFVVGELMEKS